jgi:methionine-rich copper-binding protein CopC
MQLVCRRSIALALCAAAIAVTPGRAMAHTQFEFSLPAEGTTVGDPVKEITVGFTDQVALVGNGFEVHDPQGNLLTPFVVTDDNIVFKFQLEPPLAGGAVVVDYHIRALDGDEQQGSFSFTVAAPVPTTTPPTTTPPTTTDATVTTPSISSTTISDATTTLPAVIDRMPTPPTTPDSTLPTDDGHDGSERTLMFAVLLGVAVAAGAFVLIRSRRTV